MTRPWSLIASAAVMDSLTFGEEIINLHQVSILSRGASRSTV